MSGSLAALQVIFMGTAELACASLRALAALPQFSIVAVVTQPDRPKGRKLKLQPSPVKVVAQEFGLPVLQPEKARAPEFVAELKALAPDLGVVAAYGQILPQAILDIPRYGCLNVHTSLLPKYRGAAPIQWAILNDDAETGVTIMQMDAGLDTGPMLAQRVTPITAEDDAVSLHNRLADLGAQLLTETIPVLVAGDIVPRPQCEEDSCYARKIKKEDGKMDWALPARVLWNRVRGLVPWPGGFSHILREPKPVLLKIWRSEVVPEQGAQPGQIISATDEGIVVSCGEQSLKILELQLEGGKRMSPQAFLSGHSLRVGDVLGQPITPDTAP